uniref:NEDD1 gamma-tubulin ring complex targeting factor n=1 Tax=Hippocampus comes TaxID=109280 RepID=A0A3Q2YT87_HIPCM
MDDVTRLMSTGDTVKIWDADSMTLLEQFNPHSGSHPVAQACWMANNQHVVSASSSGDKVVVSSLKSPDIPLLELAQGVSGHPSSSFSPPLSATLDHGDEVTCVSFNANDSLLASGAADGHLVLYSLTTNTSSKPFGYGTNFLRFFYFSILIFFLSPCFRSLLGSVSDGGWLTLWDANTQKELHAFRTAHKAPGSAVAFSPASELLVVSVGLDKKIVCYDTASKIIVRSIRAESPLTSVAFTPDGSGVLVGSTQGDILRYDLRNSSAPTRVTPAHATSVTCLRFQCATARHKVAPLAHSLCHTLPTPQYILVTYLLEVKRSFQLALFSAGGVGAQVASRDAGGQQGAEQFAVAEKFSSVGRNSLDMFSPLRQGDNTQPPTSAGETFGAEAGLPQICGRGSLEMFSPLREGQTADVAPRKPSAGRLLRPTSAYQTPTIKEEESTQVGDADVVPLGSALHSRASSESQRRSSSARLRLTCRRYGTLSDGWMAVGGACHRAPTLLSRSDAAAPAVTEAAGGAPAPFSGVLMNAITSIIHQSLDEDACHRDIINLQVEMIRQFCIQQNEFQALMSAQHSANEALLQENQRLKEENLRLKTNY